MLFCKDYNLEQFLSGTGCDDHGRTYEQLLQQTDDELEHNHKYIQYLFPITTRSVYALTAKTVTKDEAIKLRTEKIQQNMHKAFVRMMEFYESNAQWITPNNHNYKRISRMLESLRLFGLNEEADKLFSYVYDVYLLCPDRVSDDTFLRWHICNNTKN